MSNPYRGDVTIVLNGEPHVARLTLGALAELEDCLGEDSLMALVERFESQRFGAGDLLDLLCAGLRGGGWQGRKSDLLSAQIEGGPVQAARLAAQLLARAFSPFEDNGDGQSTS